MEFDDDDFAIIHSQSSLSFKKIEKSCCKCESGNSSFVWRCLLYIQMDRNFRASMCVGFQYFERGRQLTIQ